MEALKLTKFCQKIFTLSTGPSYTPVPANQNFQFIQENFDELTTRRGKRQGPLSPEVLSSANKLRHVGACWMCKMLKGPVTLI